jgi:hypothetical protein
MEIEMKRAIPALVLGCALSASLAGPSSAAFLFRGFADQGGTYAPSYPGPAVWRHGHWYHGPHAGRTEWWWVVGDAWYAFPAPVYPYPQQPDAVQGS